MNHVKFMFNRINNYDLLYEDIMEGNQEWGENTKRVEDHTKEYVTQVMKDIMPNLLNKSTLKCLGCLERIANEVFALETDSAEYKITFTIDTFQNKDARIIIDIVPKYIYEGIEKCYDRYLESFNRFLIISLDVLICRYSPLFRAFPALFISEEPHKSFYYPLCCRSQK